MMVKMITSCKVRPSWWLPLTWLIGARSASIMPVRLAHGRALEGLLHLWEGHHQCQIVHSVTHTTRETPLSISFERLGVIEI